MTVSVVTPYFSFKGSGGTGGVLTIQTTSPLPGGNVGVAYDLNFQGTGGLGPYTWSQIAGALPGGMTLTAAGLLAGTPTTAGVFGFTVKVTDAAANVATLVCSLTISLFSFSDNFNRANSVDGIGAGWIEDSANTTGSRILVGINANQLVLSQAVAGNSVPNHLIPRSVINVLDNVTPQFCQCRLTERGIATTFAIFGPGVFKIGSLLTSILQEFPTYALLMVNNLGAYSYLLRRISGAMGQTTLLTLAAVPANGDVMRIAVENNGASNTVHASINGVEDVGSPVVDNNAGRPLTGTPYLEINAKTNAGTVQCALDDFTCGSGV